MEKTDGEDYYRDKRFAPRSSTREKRRGKKGTSYIQRVVVLLIAFLILTALFLGPIMDFFNGPWGVGRVYPEKADYTIRRSINIGNRGGNSMDYNLTLAVPYNISGNNIQYIDDMSPNIEPEIHQKYGSDWKSWDREIDSQDSEEIQIDYSVRTKTVSWDYSGEESGTVDDISEDLKEQYNKNQWNVKDNDGNRVDRNDDDQPDVMIEPNHSAIKEKAEDIVQGEDNVYDKSRAIYGWINENIDYEIGETGRLPKHAVWVLESETGDCDEQSFLYASLSRAVGIPAWMELGVLYDRGGQRWGGHGWIRTKFVSENGSGGWVNIDLVNDQFYFRDALRFTSWVDDGKEGHLEDFYYYVNWEGGQIEIEDDFEDIRMETEGRIVSEDGWAIPGFGRWIAVPAVIISTLIYSKRTDFSP
ncbi:MAG: transglutaminase domain-containing protein [Candidatus Thermoplasmatota archaeon]|nr:transglutaminase domain-containing protein [Candidatus Thermoplasmatota archaeon]MBS3789559.1 transglutaminase domain-containing protein [Candidatus Thermoplasmatota archaeon]